MQKVSLLFLLASLVSGANAKSTEKPSPELVEIEAGSAVTIRPDRAYFLLRMYRPKGTPAVEPVFLRKPTASETDSYSKAKRAAFEIAKPGLDAERSRILEKKQAAENSGTTFKGTVPPIPAIENFNFYYDKVSNVNAIRHHKPFARGETENIYLIEAVPGDYVLYGSSWGMGSAVLQTCWCLGTVGFQVKSGEITDLGTYYGDGAKFKSKIPQLTAETGFGPSSDTPFVLMAGTIRPANVDATKPATLNGQKVVAATYYAVGKFFTPNTVGINRLIPVPGILAYERGTVIDVASGKAMPDNF